MKPPPRTRNKPDRELKHELAPQRSGKLACKWPRAEQRRLLNALQRLRGTAGAPSDVDYALLRKAVPTRSITEIQSVVETLKNKVITCASFELKKKRWKERKVRKPIEAWTELASAVAGTLEEAISTAFSQMLIVSSTEPRTLRNCDPPQVHRPPTQEDKPADRTVPLRPMPRLPAKGERPATNAAARPLLVLKTPAPTMGPARRLPAPSQVVRVTNSKTPTLHQQLSSAAGSSPAVTSQSAAPSCQRPPPPSPPPPPPAAQTATLPSSDRAAAAVTASSPAKSPSDGSAVTSEKNPTTGLHTPLPSSASGTAPSSAASTSSATSNKPPLSTPAAEVHARYGRTSKYATKDSPRTVGVKGVVDFERIYRYLSLIHKPNDECHLTHMESAIVLDLLMSLPEELPLLDCNKLHNHLIQVYQCLSAPAESSIAREMFKALKTQKQGTDEPHTAGSQDGLSCVPDGNPKPQQDGSRTNSDVTDRGGQKVHPDEAENQSQGSNNASRRTEDTDVTGLPPLNPFMVPLKLLMHR